MYTEHSGGFFLSDNNDNANRDWGEKLVTKMRKKLPFHALISTYYYQVDLLPLPALTIQLHQPTLRPHQHPLPQGNQHPPPQGNQQNTKFTSLLSSPHTFYTYLSFTPPTPTKCPSRHNHFVTLTHIICLLTVTPLTLYLIITPCVATQDVTPSSRQKRDRFTHLLRYLFVISFPFLIYER